MPKDVRRLLIFLLIIGLPSGGFVLWRWLDDRAAEKSWADYVAGARSRGVKLTVEEFFVDPAIPADENYAASPLWDRIFAGGTDPDTIIPELPRRKKPSEGTTRRSNFDPGELRASMEESKWLKPEHSALADAEAVLAGLERYRPFFEEIRSLRPRAKAWYPVNGRRGGRSSSHIRHPFTGLARRSSRELGLRWNWAVETRPSKACATPFAWLARSILLRRLFQIW